MRTIRVSMTCSMFGLLIAAPVLAYDVTGTWLGKARCKGFADGQAFAQKIDVQARLSQSGRDLNIEFEGITFITRASGVAVPNPKKPDKGELGLVSCGTEPEPVFGVTLRAKVTTKPSKGTGTIKFLALVAGKDIGDLGINDGVFSCTGSLKRTNTTDPVVGDCIP